MHEQTVIALAHAEQQDDAAAFLARTHIQLGEQLLCRIIRRSRADRRVIVHRDNSRAAAVGVRDLLRFLLELSVVVLIEQACLIEHALLCAGIHRRGFAGFRDGHDIRIRILYRKRRNEHQNRHEKCGKAQFSLVFHLRRLPYIRCSSTVSTAVSGTAILANISQNSPLSIGRSPTSRPV